MVTFVKEAKNHTVVLESIASTLKSLPPSRIQLVDGSYVCIIAQGAVLIFWVNINIRSVTLNIFFFCLKKLEKRFRRQISTLCLALINKYFFNDHVVTVFRCYSKVETNRFHKQVRLYKDFQTELYELDPAEDKWKMKF